MMSNGKYIVTISSTENLMVLQDATAPADSSGFHSMFHLFVRASSRRISCFFLEARQYYHPRGKG